MAALQPTSITTSPVLNQTGRSTHDHLVDFCSWSEAKQSLITARVYELPDQGGFLDQDALRITLNIKDFQQILNLNANSIADVYSDHLRLDGTNEADPTEIFQILNEKDPEEKKYLYSPILGILVYQILFSKDDITDNHKHFLFFNFVLKLLEDIPKNHLEAFFKALEDVVKPDDDVVQNNSMCKMSIIDIEDIKKPVAASTNSGCNGCTNKNSCTPKAAEDLGHNIVPVMSLINSIVDLAQDE